MLDWRSAGFTQLKDFWDRDKLRTQGATALNNDLSGGAATLGLAEFCNGNFIGQRAVYAEFVPTSDIHYFAFPSLANTTQPNLQEGNLWGTAVHGNVTLANFKQGTRLYISKMGAGVPVTYHSALSYLIAQHPGKASGIPVLTIDDPNVLQEYHSILIPKAVEYSAGLLDYYFRGKLNACIVAGSDTNTLGLFIENKSGTNLYGGSFQLYSEDTSGTRTLLLTTNLSDLFGDPPSLADSAYINLDFSRPTVQPAAYVVVYQGTIGTTNGSSTPLDPVDANIAIATSRIIPKYPIDTNGPTPNRLVYPDPADLGQVTVSAASESTTNWVSFGNIGPGEYQINYVAGAYVYDPDEYWTVEGSLGTVASFISGSELDDGVETLFPQKTGRFNGANYSAGPWTLDEVQSITMSKNPEADITQVATGSIALKLGAGLYYFGDPGSVTYQLQRVASLYAQPDRIRIRNYAGDVKSQLTVCTNCLMVAGETEWDGSFNTRELGGNDYASWFPDFTFDWGINGRQIDYIATEFTTVFSPGVGWVPCWSVSIWGVTSGQDVLVWQGYKMTSGTSVGTYYRDENSPMCADGLCCLYIESY